MDYSDWNEKQGNPNHYPKCLVCGSYYVEKMAQPRNAYDNCTFVCKNCGWHF